MRVKGTKVNVWYCLKSAFLFKVTQLRKLHVNKILPDFCDILTLKLSPVFSISKLFSGMYEIWMGCDGSSESKVASSGTISIGDWPSPAASGYLAAHVFGPTTQR